VREKEKNGKKQQNKKAFLLLWHETVDNESFLLSKEWPKLYLRDQ